MRRFEAFQHVHSLIRTVQTCPCMFRHVRSGTFPGAQEQFQLDAAPDATSDSCGFPRDSLVKVALAVVDHWTTAGDHCRDNFIINLACLCENFCKKIIVKITSKWFLCLLCNLPSGPRLLSMLMHWRVQQNWQVVLLHTAWLISMNGVAGILVGHVTVILLN